MGKAKVKSAQATTTTVKEHLLKVPVSSKNPKGVTVRDRHVRNLTGKFLDREQLLREFINAPNGDLKLPKKRNLLDLYKNSDDFDELIAFWNDYFSKSLKRQSLDPNSIKALIASESGFRTNPRENKIAFGITQITKQTLGILQDPKGEAQEFIFKNIRQKDLADPKVAIPLSIRWLYRKMETAQSKLGRMPTHEEVVLEYKGWLKGNSKLRESGLKNYRTHYEKLQK